MLTLSSGQGTMFIIFLGTGMFPKLKDFFLLSRNFHCKTKFLKANLKITA